jgi:hypothetical protein
MCASKVVSLLESVSRKSFQHLEKVEGLNTHYQKDSLLPIQMGIEIVKVFLSGDNAVDFSDSPFIHTFTSLSSG